MQKQHFIDATWQTGSTDTIPVVDPSTGEVFGGARRAGPHAGPLIVRVPGSFAANCLLARRLAERLRDGRQIGVGQMRLEGGTGAVLPTTSHHPVRHRDHLRQEPHRCSLPRRLSTHPRHPPELPRTGG